jgi:hypothetical protein
MGYTHYWRVSNRVGASTILDLSPFYYQAEALLGEGVSEGVLEVRDHNFFNGVKGQDHEDFYFNFFAEGFGGYRPEGSMIDYSRGFCKTNRKPYDIYVIKYLMLVKHHLGDLIDLNSDFGSWESLEQYYIDAFDNIFKVIG